MNTRLPIHHVWVRRDRGTIYHAVKADLNTPVALCGAIILDRTYEGDRRYCKKCMTRLPVAEAKEEVGIASRVLNRWTIEDEDERRAQRVRERGRVKRIELAKSVLAQAEATLRKAEGKHS